MIVEIFYCPGFFRVCVLRIENFFDFLECGFGFSDLNTVYVPEVSYLSLAGSHLAVPLPTLV